jgi:hypothetical protein
MTRRKGKPSVKRLAVPLAELEQILERTKRVLSEPEHATLKAAVDTLGLVTQELESSKTSLERLRRLLFGARTEKTDTVLGDAAEVSGEAKTSRQKPAKPPKKRKGHGRNGADAYPHAARSPAERTQSSSILAFGRSCGAPWCG